MFKFLHIADIHLGNRQYKLYEREQDFIKALASVLDPEYLKKHQVDFVVISGDLFDTVGISADIFSHTINIFSKVKALDIPIIAIEGNHDLKEYYKHSKSRGSWYTALAQNNLIYFLHPSDNADTGLLNYNNALESRNNLGGQIELTIRDQQVNIYGSRWHGSQAGSMMSTYAESIESLNYSSNIYKMLFLHAGHEKYLAVGRGGIAQADFAKLSGIVDYIGLGHIHEYHVIDNFIFNPGSLEACNITEAFQERGALLGTVNDNNQLSYELLTDYYSRAFQRFGAYELAEHNNADALIDHILADITGSVSSDQPVIVIELTGTSQYILDNAALNTLENKIIELGALHCLIRRQVAKNTEASTNPNRVFELERNQTNTELVRNIYADIIHADSEDNPDINREDMLNTMLNFKEKYAQNVSEEQLLEIL